MFLDFIHRLVGKVQKHILFNIKAIVVI